MANEQRNVLPALAQAGDAQAQHIETKVKIAPERALHHSLLEIAVGGCEDSHVNWNSTSAAHRANFLLLDGSQHFRLQIDGKFSDFIEEDGSAFSHGHESIFCLIRTGESALHVAEKLALDQSRNERSAIDWNKWLVAEWTGIMNRAGDHFLAGSAFAQDQDGMNAVSRLGDDAIELLHLGCAANDATESLFGFHFLPQQAVL